MTDLSTTYMGLELRNPVVVASCGLVKSVDGVRKAYDNGAGAVVLKSIFEEQLQSESDSLNEEMLTYAHTEAFDYVRADLGMQIGVENYVKLIEESKKAVSIPVIASVNCVSPKWWIRNAKEIESAGADALELNISRMPVDTSLSAEAIESLYVSILEEVLGTVSLPIAVKIGPYFSSLAAFAKRLCDSGASGLVFFNRFYRPDVDIYKMRATTARPFSSPEEIGWSLRWIAMMSTQLTCDLAASTGIHDSEGVVKQLLAGARVAQVCSTLYLNGMQQIERIVSGLEAWMREQMIDSVDEIRYRLQPDLSDNPEVRERLQYIKVYSGIE